MHWDNWLADTVFFNVLTTATAVFGVFGLIFQSTRSKNLEEAQFIISLNQEFINNNRNQQLLNALDSKKPLTSEELEIASQYLDFFEPLYILLKKRIINIEMIDELFCFRFFSVVNNEEIQTRILTPHQEYYGNICKLHFLWKKHHLKTQKTDLPLIETDLSYVEWYDSYCKSKRLHQKKSSYETDAVIVRDFNPNDISSLLPLYNELTRKKRSDGLSDEHIASVISDKNNRILVAELSDRIIGTAQFTICPSLAYSGRPHVVIDWFIVDKEYRRNGIGTILFERIKEEAKKENAKSIMLVSSCFRIEAHHFYKKLKFDSSVKGFRYELK